MNVKILLLPTDNKAKAPYYQVKHNIKCAVELMKCVKSFRDGDDEDDYGIEGTWEIGTHQYSNPEFFQNYHMYFISEEEPEEGEYFYLDEFTETYFEKFDVSVWGTSVNMNKVVATTDRKLGLPLIDRNFIMLWSNHEDKLSDVVLDTENSIFFYGSRPFDLLTKDDEKDKVLEKLPVVHRENFSREEVLGIIDRVITEHFNPAVEHDLQKWLKNYEKTL